MYVAFFVYQLPNRLTFADYFEVLSAALLLWFPYLVLEKLYQQSLAWQSVEQCIAEYVAIELEERMTGRLTRKIGTGNRELLKRTRNAGAGTAAIHRQLLGITPASMSGIGRRFYKG